MKSLIKETCETFGINENDLMSPSRKRELVHARIMIAVSMRRSGATLESIGKKINRDTSTVFHYVKNFQDWKEINQLPDKLKPLCYE